MSVLERDEVQEAFIRLEKLSDELIEAFATLRVIQHIVQDIPQFERGEKLPDTISPTLQTLPLFQTLAACVKPQRIFQAEKNLPKRYAGIVQLQATKHEYHDIALLVNMQNRLRERILQRMVEIEPNSRKRASLTKKMFPGILYQTMTRKVPLVPYNPQSVLLSWCAEQKSIKRLSKDQAKAIIDGINATTPEWQAQKNLARLEEVEQIFKATNVRVHPQAVITTENDDGKPSYITKKVHSPIIALSGSHRPIRYKPLEPFEGCEGERHWLKAYKPLVEGSCLVFKEEDLAK